MTRKAKRRTQSRDPQSDEPAPVTDPTSTGQRPYFEPTPEEIAAACAEIRAGWSPEEIAAACAEIRAGWSPEEEQRRRAIPNRSPEIPIVPSRDD